MNFLSIMTLLGLLSVFNLASAEENKAIILDDSPDYCTIFNLLNGGDVPDECPKMRGSVTKPKTIAFSKLVNFEYNSALLTSESLVTLGELLKVLKHEKMAQKTIQIQGHTDRKGSHNYNLLLSRKRAEAVKDYFVSHGVAASRLETDGFSFDRLYDPDHPFDSINRRAEFANLSG